MAMILWHNPRCSKSRQTLKLLNDKGFEPSLRLYLADPPDATEIQDLLDQLSLSARQLIRLNEARFKELGLADAQEAELIQAMAQNPILIERPILVTKNKAAIGRPPEAVLAIL